MKKSMLLLLLFPSFLFAQAITIDTVYSKNVNDKFTLCIRKPADYSSSKKYNHVYIVDGNIGMGDYILGKTDTWAATIPSNCIIIAIGHIGNWHEKRNRDFVPTEVTKNAKANFGKANLFYLFLKEELIPLVEKRLPNKKSCAFIGHSLGGLFCLYTLFQTDKLFDHHYAISPSCWANQNELDRIEEQFYKTSKVLKAKVTIYVGGLEFLNKVLPSTRSFFNTVSKRNYQHLNMLKNELADANHFSIRKPVVDKIFEQLKGE